MMAKMLTKVWKTAKGVFYETEREALECERLDKINGLVGEIWKELSTEAAARHKAWRAERDARGWPYSSQCVSEPSFPSIPHGFCEKLKQKLEDAGLIQPIQISTE